MAFNKPLIVVDGERTVTVYALTKGDGSAFAELCRDIDVFTASSTVPGVADLSSATFGRNQYMRALEFKILDPKREIGTVYDKAPQLLQDTDSSPQRIKGMLTRMESRMKGAGRHHE